MQSSARKRHRSVVSLLLGTIIFFIACGEDRPIEEKPKVPLSITVVYPPELKALVEFAAEQTRNEVRPEGLPEYTELSFDLQSIDALSASRAIAKGSLKPTAWISSSSAVTAMTNNTVVNLGSPQQRCMPLFYSPVVAAVHEGAWDLLSEKHGTTLALADLLNLHKVADLPKDRPTVTIGMRMPGSSVSSFSALVQLLYLGAPKISVSTLTAEHLRTSGFENDSRSLLSVVSYYAASPRNLLRWVSTSRRSLTRVAFLTEQELLSTPTEHVRSVFLREGTVVLDYELCVSGADWIGPAETSIVDIFKSTLRSDAAQELIKTLGFRVPQTSPLPVASSEPTMRVDNADKKPRSIDQKFPGLPVPVLPALDGSGFSELLNAYPKWRTPVSLVIVVDISGGMAGERLPAVQGALKRALAGRLSQPLEITLLTYDEEVQLRTRHTTNTALLIEALQPLQAGGASALHDALKAAIDQQMEPDRRKFRREILVITEGHDLGSHLAGTALIDYAAIRLGQTPLQFTFLTFSGADSVSEPITTLAEISGGEIIPVILPNLDEVLDSFMRRL